MSRIAFSDSRNGFSPELVVELLRKQAGACAICVVLLQRGNGPRGMHRDRKQILEEMLLQKSTT